MKRFVSGVGKGQRTSNDKNDLSGYIFDRYLLNGAFILLIIWCIFATISYTSVDYHFYLNCLNRGVDGFNNDGFGVCENPFYLDCPVVVEKEAPLLCESEFLGVGEYGNKPSFWFVWLVPFTIFLFALAFVINHIVYNKGDKK